MTTYLSNEEVLKHEPTIRAAVNRLLLSRRLTDVQIEREDLYQIGYVVLMDCLEHFDTERGVKFETYLTRSIYRAVNTEFEKLYKTQMAHIDKEITDKYVDDMYAIVDAVRDSGKFTPDEQKVFWARFLHKTSYRQIERETGICRKKAHVMYDKVLDTIKEDFES